MSVGTRWPRRALGELVIGGDISYGVVQPGQSVSDGVPIVRVKDLVDGHIDRREPMRVVQEIAAQHGRTALVGGELLVTVVGSVGETAVVPPELAGWNVARAIAVLRPRDVSARWLGYCIQSPDVRAEFDSMLNTTVQATLNLGDLKRLQVPVPPASHQTAILEVLGALDDKIVANARLAEIADALVRAQFEEFRSTESRLTIGVIAENVRQLVDPSLIPPNSLYVGLEHIPRRRMWMDSVGRAGEVTSDKAKFLSGDILFGKLRPYFHKVISAPEIGICSTDVLVVRAIDHGLQGFLLAACASDEAVQACTASSEGTRMPRTSWNDLAKVVVPWPGEGTAKSFSCEIAQLQGRVDAATAESRRLAALRDALLPGLMSGRLRIKDAERLVEGKVE